MNENLELARSIISHAELARNLETNREQIVPSESTEVVLMGTSVQRARCKNQRMLLEKVSN